MSQTRTNVDFPIAASFVRDGRREVHALDERLSQERIDRVWAGVVAAMERGDAPRADEARFHAQEG